MEKEKEEMEATRRGGYKPGDAVRFPEACESDSLHCQCPAAGMTGTVLEVFPDNVNSDEDILLVEFPDGMVVSCSFFNKMVANDEEYGAITECPLHARQVEPVRGGYDTRGMMPLDKWAGNITKSDVSKELEKLAESVKKISNRLKCQYDVLHRYLGKLETLNKCRYVSPERVMVLKEKLSGCVRSMTAILDVLEMGAYRDDGPCAPNRASPPPARKWWWQWWRRKNQ